MNLTAYTNLATAAAAENELVADGFSIDRLNPTLEELRDVFHHISELTSLRLEALGYHSKASEALMGYAECKFEDLTIFVPHTLAASFPSPSSLKDILEVAKKVAITNPIEILVSGSGALSGDLPAIGDLDFCQYIERYHGEFFAEIGKEKLTRFDSTDFKSISMKWNGKKILSPFENIEQTIEAARKSFSCRTESSHGNWKFDYVGKYGTENPVAITNMTIPVEFSSWEDTAAGKSWAFQEALISATGAPPRQLTSFGAWGAYVNWLRHETRNYLANEASVPKAAKRAYSLASSLFLYGEGQDIRKSITKPSIQSKINIDASNEALGLLSLIGSKNCEMAETLADSVNCSNNINEKQLTTDLNKCREKVKSFLVSVDKLVSDAKPHYLQDLK